MVCLDILGRRWYMSLFRQCKCNAKCNYLALVFLWHLLPFSEPWAGPLILYCGCAGYVRDLLLALWARDPDDLPQPASSQTCWSTACKPAFWVWINICKIGHQIASDGLFEHFGGVFLGSWKRKEVCDTVASRFRIVKSASCCTWVKFVFVSYKKQHL